MPRLPIYIWSFCQFIHLLNFQWWVDDLLWPGLITGMSLMAVWVTKSRPLFVLTSAVFVLALWSFRMPQMAKHIQFECILALFVAGWAVKKLLLSGKEMNLGSIIRLGLPFIYLLAAFQKLNHEYLFTEHSYALFLVNGVLDGLAVDPMQSPGIIALASIIWELSIGLLLFIPRARIWALALGVLFHLSMTATGLGGVMDFSIMALLYFFLFLPQSRQESICAAIEFVHWVIILLGFAGLGLLCMLLSRWGAWTGMIEVATYFAGMLFIFLVLRKSVGANWSMPNPPGSVRWTLPIILSAVALLPHFGHRTALAFDMFSNLRTEPGYENHLFMPSIGLWGYQENLVTVVESNIESLMLPLRTPLQNREAKLTEMGLKQYLSGQLWGEDPRVIYHIGERIDSIIGTPRLNLFERKFLVFDLVPAKSGKAFAPEK